jgi:hypothetical protein
VLRWILVGALWTMLSIVLAYVGMTVAEARRLRLEALDEYLD